MALSIDYALRETFSNLRRNVLMTSAAVLTVAVSLSLVGGALLLKQGVANATIHHKFITPKVNAVAISAQQQPTQKSPWWRPMRNAPMGPLRQYVRK